MTDVRTPGNKTIAKKWGLSSKVVNRLVKRGAEEEKEHDTNMSKAAETARDHIGERPDYYRMLKKAEKMDKKPLNETNKENKEKKRRYEENNAKKDIKKLKLKGDWKHLGTSQLRRFNRRHDVNEETINELSKDTLKSYIKKASDSRSDAQYRAQNYENKPTHENKKAASWKKKKDWAKYGNDLRTVRKRRNGLRQAVDKLEETQINELSKGTLKSYIRKAGNNIKKLQNHPSIQAANDSLAQDSARNRRYPSDKSYRLGAAAKPVRDKIGKRYDGVSDASDRIEKRGDKKFYKMSEEHINELSNKLMHKYIKRAKGELDARDYVTRSGGDYVKNPDLFQNGPPSKYDKEVTDQYPKIHKRQRGIERATTAMNVREDEQIDEIANTMKGQGTLIKYVRGAAKDLYNTGQIQGHDAASNPRPNGGETEARKMSKRIAKNRTTGIERAVKRMNPGIKEEQMDSLNESHKALVAAGYKATSKRDGEHGFGRTYQHPQHGSAYMDADNFVHFGHGKKETVTHGAKETSAHLSKLSEENRTDKYIGTVNVGDWDSENKMKRHIDQVKSYNKANGTAFRVERKGRLGKNNPKAGKYSRTKPGFTYDVHKGDEDRNDYYVRPKDWDRRQGKDTRPKHIHAIKKELKEETMENEKLVAEAINNILEGNLEQMRQNLFDTLEHRAMEKLEERKKDIASNYFAQE